MRAMTLTQRWTSAVSAIAVALVILPSGASGNAQTSSENGEDTTGLATAEELDSFVRQQRAELRFAGLEVVVLNHGSVEFQSGYGESVPGGHAVTIDTPFVLGSTSKQFTGLVVQRLIAQNRLALGDTIGTLLVRLGGTASAYAAVTVEQLLAQTSGLETPEGIGELDVWPSVTSITAEARRVLEGTPAFKPGIHWEYSNANYAVLGAIIEEVTGEPFEQALQTLVAKPLGLTSTTSNLALARAHGLAAENYSWFGMFDTVTPGPTWPKNAPAVLVTSNARDLTRLLQAELGETTGLDATMLAAAQTPIARINKYSQYASGWFVRPLWEAHNFDEHWDDPANPVLWEHNGNTDRSVSYLAFAPSTGLGVIVLSNTGLGTDQDRLSRFTYGLIHKILGTRASPQPVDPLVSAAPAIMIGLPVLQIAMFIWLLFTHRRRSRWARGIPLGFGALVTASSLYFTLVLVPQRSLVPLLNQGWWSATPDLAVSVGVSLVLVVLWPALCISGAVGTFHRRRRPSTQHRFDHSRV